MKAFITKYALTKGIYEIDAEVCQNPKIIKRASGNWVDYYRNEGKDWHKTKESAILRANEMRAAKIKTLQKQIIKLDKLTF